jgi:hypothetical protein
MQSQGYISSIHGDVVEIDFPRDLPRINDALVVHKPDKTGIINYTLTLLCMTIVDKRSQITAKRVLPPDRERLRAFRPVVFPPIIHLEPRDVFAKALEELLFISLYRCYLESLRSEIWFRLRSMEGASESLNKRIAELGSLQNYVRQEEITEEMLEILGSGTVISRRSRGEP